MTPTPQPAEPAPDIVERLLSLADDYADAFAETHGWTDASDRACPSYGAQREALAEAVRAALSERAEPESAQAVALQIEPASAEGSAFVGARWFVETPAGWVGAWDRGAIEWLAANGLAAPEATTPEPRP